MFPIRDHNPARKPAYVTWTLMAINIAVFLATLGIEADQQAALRFYYDYALIPARLSGGENPSALLSSAFLHGGFLHLAGNMLFLWIFGDNMEDQMGHLAYLVFYLACGTAAGLAQVVASPHSLVPMVGASGAIAGIMGGYFLMFPKARVDILLILIVYIRTFAMPAWIMLGIWFGFQLVNSVISDPDAGGVAYWAHSGGFIIGFVLTLPLWLMRGGRRFWSRTHGTPPHPPTQLKRRSTIPRVRK